VAAGFVSGIVVVGGTVAVRHAVTAPPARQDRAVQAGPLAEPPAAPRAEAPAAAAHEPSAPASEPAPTSPATAPRPMSSAPGKPVPTEAARPAPVLDAAMEVEVRLLDEARRAVAEGRGRDALDVLRRYARDVRGQRLAPEAWYLEMEANRVIGDRAAAVRSAKNLLERYPEGPHAARARRIVSGE
jgi:hypothetical protein